jgi:ABC-type glycerol-3-phosphate transport system substrate-binding protein
MEKQTSGAGATGAAATGAVRRRRFLAAGGGATVALLAACGPGGPAGRADAGPARPPVAGPARLQLWFTLPGPQADHLTRVNARFTGEDPRIGVELLTVSDAELTVKLAAALAAGTRPDLATLGGATRLAELIAAKRVASPSGYRRDLARLDWADALKAIAARGDDLYALPVLASPLALFYNADLYQRAGLDPTTPPPTWDALLANAQAIARLAPPVWGHAVATRPIPRAAEQIWLASLWRAGGEWLTPDGTRAAFNGPAASRRCSSGRTWCSGSGWRPRRRWTTWCWGRTSRPAGWATCPSTRCGRSAPRG